MSKGLRRMRNRENLYVLVVRKSKVEAVIHKKKNHFTNYYQIDSKKFQWWNIFMELKLFDYNKWHLKFLKNEYYKTILPLERKSSMITFN